MSAPVPADSRKIGPILFGVAGALALIALFVVMAVRTHPIRQAVGAYTRLMAAANAEDVDGVRRLCSARYLWTHRIAPTAEGGIVGLPRSIHTRFQAWRQDGNVWICPTNKVGPIYQFVPEGDAWKFDGPVGYLRGRNQVIRSADEPGLPTEADLKGEEPPKGPQ